MKVAKGASDDVCGALSAFSEASLCIATSVARRPVMHSIVGFPQNCIWTRPRRPSAFRLSHVIRLDEHHTLYVRESPITPDWIRIFGNLEVEVFCLQSSDFPTPDPVDLATVRLRHQGRSDPITFTWVRRPACGVGNAPNAQ